MQHQCSDSHRATFHIDIMVECMIPCLIEIESGQWQTTGFAFDWPTFLIFFAQKLLSRCTLYLLRSKTPEDSRRTLESLEDSTLEQKLLGSLGHRWRLGPLAMLGGRRKRRKRIWFSCSLVPVSDTWIHFEKSQMSQLCLKLCVNCVNCSLTRCQKSSHTCFSTAVSWNHGRHFVTLGFDRSQLVGLTMLDAALAKSKHQKCIKCRWHFQSRHYVCTSIIFYNHLYT